MARVVIADAGPLTALAGIDELGILRDLFGQVAVPDAVKDECTAKKGRDAERIAAAISAGWLVLREGGPKGADKPLTPSLGAGESKAIALALDGPDASLLIMDDRLARRYALRRSLSVIGTVRVLTLAEDRGLIESAAHCIEAMAGNGYRISRDLLEVTRRGGKATCPGRCGGQ